MLTVARVCRCWSRWHAREGFVGDSTSIVRPHHTPDYLSVEGLHVPHRLQLGALPLPDRDDAEALPLAFLVGRSGLQLCASAREAATSSTASVADASQTPAPPWTGLFAGFQRTCNAD